MRYFFTIILDLFYLKQNIEDVGIKLYRFVNS